MIVSQNHRWQCVVWCLRGARQEWLKTCKTASKLVITFTIQSLVKKKRRKQSEKIDSIQFSFSYSTTFCIISSISPNFCHHHSQLRLLQLYLSAYCLQNIFDSIQKKLALNNSHNEKTKTQLVKTHASFDCQIYKYDIIYVVSALHYTPYYIL